MFSIRNTIFLLGSVATAFASSLTPCTDNCAAITSAVATTTTTATTTTATGVLPSTDTTQQTVTLALKQGWNMLSSPINGQKVAASYLKGQGAAAIWEFNATSQTYFAPTYIEPGIGYWISANQQLNIALSSTNLLAATSINLNTALSKAVLGKWNMMGAPVDTTKTAIKSMGASSVWWYDPSQSNYSTSDAIAAGNGFWYLSNKAVAPTSSSGSLTPAN